VTKDFDERGRIIGRAYMAAESYSVAALESFAAFRDETVRQYEELRRKLRITVTSHDPYDLSLEFRDMFADIRNGRISVLSAATTGGHPFLTDAENEAFRAVHDYYGHFRTGRIFDRYGEDAAWRAHSQMYSAAARPAMTTETRGQNSALNFALGAFPEQKISLLTDWMWQQ
jgi:hypothetical protein